MRSLACVLILACVLVVPAGAAGPAVDLSDYIITSWTMKDGLPSDVIWTIAQDHDGYLWMGTNGGLVRFDGVRFVTWESVGGTPLPRVPVRSLFVSRDGDLWVGFSFSETGGISRIHKDQVQTFGPGDGLERGAITALVEDLEGTMWAGSNAGLFRLSSDRWSRVPSSSGLPAARVDSLYVDRPGNLLVGTAAGVFRKSQSLPRFQQVDTPDDAPPVFRGFSEDRAGQIWVTDPVGGFRRLGDRTTTTRERGRGNTLLHDHDGNLWVTTMGEGIWRVSREGANAVGRVEKARAPGARAIFEDRDGQIWAGNGDGLIRLTKPKVTPITDLGLVYGVQTTADGAVWATTADSVIRFPSPNERRGARQEIRHAGIRTLRVDEHGALWVATSSALIRFLGEQHTFPLPHGAALNRINSIASDWDGGLWVSDRDQGLFKWNPQRPNAMEPVRDLAQTRISTLYTDSHGRLWFASTSGGIGVIERTGQIRMFGPESGLGVGPYTALYEDSRNVMWVGGADGLKLYADRKFVSLNNGNRFRGVVGLVEDAEGDFWLGSGSGLVFIARAEIDKAVAQPSHEVSVRVFDAGDGLAGLPVSFGNPTEVKDSAGRLWFVTGRGLTAFDPRVLESSGAAPVAKIEDAVVDERAVDITRGLRLTAQTERVAIDYSVLDLTTPWRTRFRYRLEGFDSQWIDAGSHRQAVYTHLPPGNYVFRVAASNVDGSWGEAAATWPFSVAPMFYQTVWFYGVCALTLGLATWGLWQLRLRHVRRQFALLIGERARLSREVHDTLLQSLVGVALQFDALGANLDPSSPERQQLVRIRKEVEQYIREARHSIWNLRKPVIGGRDLPTSLREAALRVTAGQSIGFEFSVCGTPFPCLPETEEQLTRICQEAVLNAIRHASPERVRVELRYEGESIVLRVTDDGRGFDPQSAPPLEAAGHYGLVSMRERAAQVGGIFTLTTSLRSGTSIEARVPAGAHA